MVAGLVGFAHDSRVTLCSVEGSISGNKWTGGLVGYAVHARVEQSCTEVSVLGGGDVGGLIAFASGSALAECYSLGQIEGSPLSQNMGGFIGEGGSLRIANCYSSFDVNGPFFRAMGGFMGSSSGDVLKFCYSSGRVGHSSADSIWSPPGSWSGTGSFIGYRSFSVWRDQVAEACFWDMDTSGIDVGVNYVMDYTDIDLPYEDIFRTTTQQMHTEKTYTDVGWDFESIWTIEEGAGYPVLQWESPGDSEGQ